MTADNDPRDAAGLASAYLDGDVTDDERARVEADPALLAEVERLRRVRAAVGEIVPVPEATRDAAIAAALAAFDETRPTTAGTAPKVVPLERRRLAHRIQLMSAVAAVAVLVIGGFVIANLDGDEDDDSAAEREAVVSASAGPPDTERSPAAAPAPTTATLAAPATTQVQSAELAIETAEMGTADVPLAAAPAQGSADEPSTQDAGAAAATTVVVTDAEELGDLAAALSQEAPTLEDVITACQQDPAGLDADAAFVDGDAEIPIVVASSDGGFVAVSLDDCTIVLETG